MSAMIIVMKKDATEADIAHVVERLESIESQAHISKGRYRTVIGALGDRDRIQQLPWEAMPGVERAVPVLKPFKFVSRDFQEENTVIEVRGARIGGGTFTNDGGPLHPHTTESLPGRSLDPERYRFFEGTEP